MGVVQGFTEFLPISSSGHLVLFQTLFGMKEPMVAFDIALHGGTLLAVLVYFYRDVRDVMADFWGSVAKKNPEKTKDAAGVQAPHKGLWVCILITMIPTGLVAVFFKDFFEKAFTNLTFVACAWLVMGIWLILSERFQKGQKDLSCVHYGDAFWVGLVQGVALMPGISRSGSTILAGMGLGFRKETAAKFSFLISIPAVAAAIVLDLKHSISFFISHPAPMVTGFAVSAVVGYLVVRWLMAVIHKGQFFVFGYYCVAVSLFSFIFAFLSK